MLSIGAARRTAMVAGLVLTLQMVLAGPASAADGEVISNSNDPAGNVYQSGDYARLNFNNVGDCPTSISGCWVEV